jgi:acyl-coenzyme A synthetase/AMP-(fatty) acid ligase
MRAGYLPFPISPRNSAAGVAHLITKVGVSYVLVSQDEAMTKLMRDAKAQLSDEVSPTILEMLVFADLYRSNNQIQVADLPKAEADQSAPCIILHSSGNVSSSYILTVANTLVFRHHSIP